MGKNFDSLPREEGIDRVSRGDRRTDAGGRADGSLISQTRGNFCSLLVRLLREKLLACCSLSLSLSLYPFWKLEIACHKSGRRDRGSGALNTASRQVVFGYGGYHIRCPLRRGRRSKYPKFAYSTVLEESSSTFFERLPPHTMNNASRCLWPRQQPIEKDAQTFLQNV